MKKKIPDKRRFLMLAAAVLSLLAAAVFWPRPKADPLAEAISRYRLPENFTRSDLDGLLQAMAADKEFQFYFYALEGERQIAGAQEVFGFLMEHPDRAAVRERIVQLQEDVHTDSLLFYYLEYDDNFIRDPGAYPELERVYRDFIEKEFKLALLGVYYKANVDRNFTFVWQPAAVDAAQKFRDLWQRRQEYVLGAGR